MDISPLTDKQRRNNNRNRRNRSEDSSRLDEYSPLPQATATTSEVLTNRRIQHLIEELNHITGSTDISFVLKQASVRPSRHTIVEVVDTQREELLLELTMRDLVEIEKQIKEDRVEDLSEFMCGSFFSLTA